MEHEATIPLGDQSWYHTLSSLSVVTVSPFGMLAPSLFCIQQLVQVQLIGKDKDGFQSFDWQAGQGPHRMSSRGCASSSNGLLVSAHQRESSAHHKYVLSTKTWKKS
jgi:hypothetical protein